ncbi:MAG: hypothetical protein WBA43_13255 [Elainellaceae cyanobacterium]
MSIGSIGSVSPQCSLITKAVSKTSSEHLDPCSADREERSLNLFSGPPCLKS